MWVFAVSDLHLSFSGKKPMDLFGEHWADHHTQVERAWRKVVSPEDVVCLSGDFSWASKLDEAQQELDWLETLPGKKVLIKEIPSKKANITCRNFPESVQQIRKKTGLKEGGDVYLYATTDLDNNKIIILSKRL